MSDNTVQLKITFETLVEAINNLNMSDKIRLWDMLELEIAATEDADPTVQAEIQQALDDYASGDYVTLKEYLEQKKDN